MINKYDKFVSERKEQSELNGEILNVLDYFVDVDTKDILSFRDSLKEVVDSNESLNEGVVGDFVKKVKMKFKDVIDDQVWKYIINRKKDFYVKLIEDLNIFDLTSLDDVVGNHPNFKLESLYLAGGMDKAVDVGAGWRNLVEQEFEELSDKDSDLPEIKVNNKETTPKRVVDGEFLNMFLDNPTKTKRLYDKPLILNPVRKEVDRTKDPHFAAAATKYKSFHQETEPEEYEPTMTNIRKTLSTTIEPDDEHLVRLASGTFLGLNKVASSGTFGELQTVSYMNKPMFVWMTEPGWKFSDFSMWTFPHISKLARNDSEMKILIKTLSDFA